MNKLERELNRIASAHGSLGEIGEQMKGIFRSHPLQALTSGVAGCYVDPDTGERTNYATKAEVNAKAKEL